MSYEYGIHLIRRGKIVGPGWHYGVLSVGVVSLGEDIIDLNRGGEVRHWTSLEVWAKGREFQRAATCARDDIDGALARMRAAIDDGAGYHLLQNNCEHFARWIVTRNRASFQVSHTVLALAGIALLILVLRSG